MNCIKCDKKDVSLNYIHKDTLVEQQMCFNCNFWREILINDKAVTEPHITCVIEGHHYQFRKGISPGNSNHKGMGGRVFNIKMASGEEVETNDLWYQGEIPEVWRSEFPDNAEFKQGGYAKLSGPTTGAWAN